MATAKLRIRRKNYGKWQINYVVTMDSGEYKNVVPRIVVFKICL